MEPDSPQFPNRIPTLAEMLNAEPKDKKKSAPSKGIPTLREMLDEDK